MWCVCVWCVCGVWCICVIAFSCHCLIATARTVSHVPLSGCSDLGSSINFGRAISASQDLTGFEEAC